MQTCFVFPEAPLRVICAEDDLIDLGPITCPGTHLARFKGNVKRAFFQVLPSEVIRCGRKSLHLRMSGNVIEGLGQIMSPGNNLVPDNNDRTDRNFAPSSGLGRESGIEGMMEYVQTKSVWMAQESSVANPFIMR